MANEKLNSIGDYERYIEAIIEAWSPEQRIALAAAMAERWLPVYDAFSAREEWGDPAHLRRSLEAVWNHLQGKSLSPGDVARYMKQMEDSTPHMDFTDDVAALAACMMLSEALRCCKSADNLIPAMQAVISGFEAIELDWNMDPAEQSRLWRQIKVQREFEKQRKLVEQIGAITQFDNATIQALRKKLTRKEYLGEGMPVPKSAPGPATITNQKAFEQYHGIIEVDLRPINFEGWEKLDTEPGSYMWAMMVFSAWNRRYSRRRSIINGTYGQLADVIGQQALIARQQWLDSAVPTIPDWGSELNGLMNMSLQNQPHLYDVTAFDQPHHYGPSLRRLWTEGQQLDDPTLEPWQHIIAWSRHRPAAWEVEDQRKKQGLAHTTPALGELLARELSWNTTDNPEYPWATEVDGERWQIRLNDFPDDFMYSLIIDGKGVGDFHDWPETWQRDHGNPT